MPGLRIGRGGSELWAEERKEAQRAALGADPSGHRLEPVGYPIAAPITILSTFPRSSPASSGMRGVDTAPGIQAPIHTDRRGITMADNVLFRWRRAIASEHGPDPSTRLVLLVLSLRMDLEGNGCFPGTRLLAEHTGLSRRCVTEKIDMAAIDGWIQITETIRRGINENGNPYGCRARTYTPAFPDGLDTVSVQPHHLGLATQRDQPKGGVGDDDDKGLATQRRRNSSKKSSLKKNIRDNSGFRPPTPEEVEAYARSIDFEISGQRFCDHYEATDWHRGKTKIKNWQACVRTWKHRNAEQAPADDLEYYGKT